VTLTLFIQVRDAVGGLICKLGANILGSSQVNQGHIMGSKIKDWSTMLVESAESAVIVIQSKGTAGVSKMCVDDTSSDSSKEALKCIETALHFVVAAIRSGNAAVLMPVLLRLLQPVLALQDTWDKDVQALAKSTMQLLMWQAFSKEQLDEVAEAVLSAADQSNWHTRVAALTFLSPLVFRYTKP
jgi:proteasome activator subunit 4